MIAQLNWLYIQTRPYKVLPRLLSYALFEGRPVTTKGRWINPLVFTLFDLEKSLPAIKQVEKPIFIVGTGRSGSTLLGVLLSLHPDVGFLNEPKALWHSIYPLEDLTGSYGQNKASYYLTEKEVTDKIRQNAYRLFGSYLAITGSKRVVDKYPEMIFRVPFIQTIFPDAKFIFLVRNGWNTCQSIAKWSDRFGTYENSTVSDWWGIDNRKWHLLVEQLVCQNANFKDIQAKVQSFDSHVDKGAVEWIVTMKQGLKHMQQNPHNFYQLRYEELTSDPIKSLTKLLEFCELPYDRKLIDYACQTISPPISSDSVTINPAIQTLFEETMYQLGY